MNHIDPQGADKPCKDCDGDGWQEHLTEDLQYHSWICKTCNGTGVIKDE